ncbi:TetR/AcrR family transcriptional regulator [Pelobacter seleniigenes]|uniref:TetR/AcrR family transcriptional regulator n=1 Tax=Pelobacter seleniigenes TaxID=407188 RepID=UPI00068ACB92|nr:TetR/AcrR family transcriptional regulator [Pelobacter seleniigenes]
MKINPQKTKRRSTLKHRAILEAAATCIARHGYAATTIEAIAAEASVGKQTIYRWWSSKSALFVEVYTEIVSREALAISYTGRARNDLEAVLKALFTLYRQTCAGAILAGLIGDAVMDTAARTALAEGLVTGRADIVTDIIRSGIARGELSAVPEIVNEVVVAMVWKRLVINIESLNDDFAVNLATLAISAGKTGVQL